MSTLKTQPFDPAAYLDDAESLAAYMSEALATEDPAFIADALGVVARARGMSAVSYTHLRRQYCPSNRTRGFSVSLACLAQASSTCDAKSVAHGECQSVSGIQGDNRRESFP